MCHNAALRVRIKNGDRLLLFWIFNANNFGRDNLLIKLGEIIEVVILSYTRDCKYCKPEVYFAHTDHRKRFLKTSSQLLIRL